MIHRSRDLWLIHRYRGLWLIHRYRGLWLIHKYRGLWLIPTRPNANTGRVGINGIPPAPPTALEGGGNHLVSTALLCTTRRRIPASASAHQGPGQGKLIPLGGAHYRKHPPGERPLPPATRSELFTPFRPSIESQVSDFTIQGKSTFSRTWIQFALHC